MLQDFHVSVSKEHTCFWTVNDKFPPNPFHEENNCILKIPAFLRFYLFLLLDYRKTKWETFYLMCKQSNVFDHVSCGISFQDIDITAPSLEILFSTVMKMLLLKCNDIT